MSEKSKGDAGNKGKADSSGRGTADARAGCVAQQVCVVCGVLSALWFSTPRALRDCSL